MKLQEAMAIIQTPVGPAGFVVRFQRVTAGLVEQDLFPEIGAGEPPLESEADALDLATRFAARTRGRFYNVVVMAVGDVQPSDEALERMLNVR